MFSVRKKFGMASSKAVQTGKASAFEAAENDAYSGSKIYHIAVEIRTLRHLP